MKEVSKLSRKELVDSLKKLALENNTKEDFDKAVKQELPGVAAIVTYTTCGPMKMHMGMAMSHWHLGTIQF